jgi:hypothetical protein
MIIDLDLHSVPGVSGGIDSHRITLWQFARGHGYSTG